MAVSSRAFYSFLHIHIFNLFPILFLHLFSYTPCDSAEFCQHNPSHHFQLFLDTILLVANMCPFYLDPTLSFTILFVQLYSEVNVEKR